MVVATTGTCRNMDGLYENFRIKKCLVHIAASMYTNNTLFHAENKRTSLPMKECPPFTFQHDDSGRQVINTQTQT
jgi:hypothetical protein